MAILHGIEIKNRKENTGHEGEVVYSGDLYLRGEYIGKWQEDLIGGPLTYDFDITLIKEALAKYIKKSEKVFFDFSPHRILACLISDLNCMINNEKMVRSFLEEGYKSIILVTDGYHFIWTGTMEPPEHTIEKNPKAVEASKKYLSPEIKPIVQVFSSLEDFIIE